MSFFLISCGHCFLAYLLLPARVEKNVLGTKKGSNLPHSTPGISIEGDNFLLKLPSLCGSRIRYSWIFASLDFLCRFKKNFFDYFIDRSSCQVYAMLRDCFRPV